MRLSGLIKQAILVLEKEIKEEFRSKVAVSTILLFSLSVLFLVSFALGGCRISYEVSSALLWIILFFANLSALGHSFIREEECGTSLALRLSARPEAIFWGKWLFNLILAGVLFIVVIPLFLVLFEQRVERPLDFVLILILGESGLITATTLLASIVAKASQKGTLLTILAFPVLIPLLMTVTRGTVKALGGAETIGADTLSFLLSYPVVIGGISTLLFPIIWES